MKLVGIELVGDLKQCNKDLLLHQKVDDVKLAAVPAKHFNRVGFIEVFLRYVLQCKRYNGYYFTCC